MEEISNSAIDLISRLRTTYPVTASLNLVFGQVRIAVKTNQPTLVEVLKEYFGSFTSTAGPADITITAHEAPIQTFPFSFTQKMPDPGKTKVKEEYVELDDGRIVRKRLTGLCFVFNGRDHLAIGPCLSNANQIVNFINNRYIQWKLHRGCLLGHAAGVLYRGRGLALAGFSGMGKSTLALHLVSRGTSFVSNDRLLISPNGSGLEMNGVAKLPRINPGTVLNNPMLSSVIPEEEKAAFKSLPKEELWDLEHKYDVPIGGIFGPSRFALSAPMLGLVILNWDRTEAPVTAQEVDLDQRRNLLAAFIKSEGLFYLPLSDGSERDRSAAAYATLLSRCRVWEVRGGTDFYAAANICFRFLETQG
ncbi:MAG: HprK-related kinase B [Deltaproteobacteria bacterium]|nr:HprK-related kinase B [Deltaproteobacteria bacterium]